MFGGIGTGEILILLVIALIVIGPKKLPEVARTIGRGLAELRRASYDLQRTLSLEELENAASRMPDPTATQRLHEKTAADNLEVSGTRRKSGNPSRAPYPDVDPEGGDQATQAGEEGSAGLGEQAAGSQAVPEGREHASRERKQDTTSEPGVDREAAGPETSRGKSDTAPAAEKGGEH